MESIKRKSGTKYRAKVQINGKRITKTFSRKYDAEKWKREQLNEREKIELYGIPVVQESTLADFSVLWLKNKADLAQRSKDSYSSSLNQHLIPMFGNLPLKAIKIHHAQALIVQLREKGLGEVRINFIIRFLKQLLNDAIKWDYLLHHPLKNLNKLKEPPKPERYWMPHEIQKFLDANQDHHFYPLFVTALNTGARRGELLGLQWDQVDFANKQIKISRIRDRYGLKDTTKTGKITYIPMNSTVLKTLSELRKNSTSMDYVFVDEKGHPPFLEHVSDRLFKRAIKRANVTEIKFHNLRTTFAANFCMNHGNVYTLSKILGHSTVEMTAKKYAHLHPSFMNNAMEIVSFEAGGSQKAHSPLVLVGSS